MMDMFILMIIMVIATIFTFVLIIGDGLDSDNGINQEKKEENKIVKYT